MFWKRNKNKKRKESYNKELSDMDLKGKRKKLRNTNDNKELDEFSFDALKRRGKEDEV
jgi:hypothetical protein